MPVIYNETGVHGWLNLYKPSGMGSTSALGRVRYLMGKALRAQGFEVKLKAGHAGTLDPMAEGVLPIALGEATKTISFMMDAQKTYEARVLWGAQTDSLDADGIIVHKSDMRPTAQAVQNALPALTGQIMQVPPAFSALKINGQRAYDLARAGQAPEMVARPAFIHSMEVLTHTPQYTDIRIVCAKGTYIRSIARDLAHNLGGYAHLSALKRTSVRKFHAKAAFSLDQIEKLVHKGGALQILEDVHCVLDDIPVRQVDKFEQDFLKQGRAILTRFAYDTSHVATFYNDKIVALCNVKEGKLMPKRVFNL